MDWWTKLEGEEQKSCIKSRRVTKSPATCWNAGRFTSVTLQGVMHGSDGRGDRAAEASSE
jgi:hypothetical protein